MKNKYFWRLIFYKFLELLPDKCADFLFNNLQKVFGQTGASKYVKSGQSFVKLVFNSEFSKNSTIAIELGTGWYPIVPLLIIRELPNTEIFSYDLRKLMSTQNYSETKLALKINSTLFDERFNYKSGVDLVNHEFLEIQKNQDGQVFIFSKATLQHIPLDIIKGIHKNLIYNYPSHRVYHLINCNDHRQHTDKSLSKFEFLKYDELLWLKKCTRFDYHNRMRAIEYKALFLELGYDILNYQFEYASLKDINEYNSRILPIINKRFKGYSLEENTSGSLFFELKIGEI
jgi:hypothetical protein